MRARYKLSITIIFFQYVSVDFLSLDLIYNRVGDRRYLTPDLQIVSRGTIKVLKINEKSTAESDKFYSSKFF